MFDPVRVSHDDIVKRAIAAVRAVKRQFVADAFVVSLSSRRLDLRSALGNFAAFQHIAKHPAPRDREPCPVCGDYGRRKQQEDLNVLNFERFKWGGVRHDQPLYASMDLNLFRKLARVTPKPEDVAVFKGVLKAIEAAALLHDTGKLAVPERILNKPGKLTVTEFETMKLHVDVGADILSAIDFPFPVVPIVRAHHERWDGKGYPNGLAGTAIPIGARILSVVDCYDALTSDRPYRTALTDEQALDIIRAGRGTMYDPDLVDLFERTFRDIGPIRATASPDLQNAVRLISNAVAGPALGPAMQATPGNGLAAEPTVTPVAADGPEALMTLINLTRIIGGRPTAADVAAMVWMHVRHLVPRASGAFFMLDGTGNTLSARFAGGDASAVLQGLTVDIGDKLTGWVAEHRQPIVNSDAQLDLGPEAAIAGLRFCLALPLDRLGVLSFYAPEPFGDDEARMLQMVAPHLAQMFVALEERPEAAPARTRSRSPLRIVGGG